MCLTASSTQPHTIRFSSSNSPESGIGLSSQSLPSSDNKSELDGRESNNSADDEEEAFDSDPLPIIGRCRALYPFEGEESERQMANVMGKLPLDNLLKSQGFLFEISTKISFMPSNE